ncbi:LapA family protein [Tropicimonas sp.]|uniref:LapA family protein n=1 Tax=Tropicimonas sp. TaxID=2067044 RepID=UPI003A88BAC4
MMRYVRYLILAALLAVLVVIAMANWQMVTLTLLPAALAEAVGWNFTTPQVPLFLVILFSIALGLLIGYVFEWIRESKYRSEVARRQRQVKKLNREVSRLQGETNKGKDEVVAMLEMPKKALG